MGHAPEHVLQVPICPLPQPWEYWPEGQELGQLAQTRLVVVVQPETSYWVEVQAMHGTAATTE